jgi:hypothetical protein
MFAIQFSFVFQSQQRNEPEDASERLLVIGSFDARWIIQASGEHVKELAHNPIE